MNSCIVAFIKPNSFTVDVSNLDAVKKLTIDDIKSDIAEYIDFKTVKPEELMELIVATLQLDSKLMADTAKCHETADNIYQMCHLNMSYNGGTNEESQVNGLASYLGLGAVSVYGYAILMKSTRTEDGTCVLDNVDLDQIAEILYGKFVHKAVKIPVEGPLEVITYYNSPVDGLSSEEKDNTRFVELSSLCSFNLIVVVKVDLNEEQDKVNKRATKLLGTARVHGDVILASKSTESEYLDVDIDLYNKLWTVAGMSLKDRAIKEDELNDDKVNNLQVLVNRYVVLNNRYDKYQKRCSCGGDECESIKDSICSGCYRMNYSSSVCQQTHWDVHREDCLHKKSSLNSFIKQKSLEQESNQPAKIEEITDTASN